VASRRKSEFLTNMSHELPHHGMGPSREEIKDVQVKMGKSQ
jgi:hypothetical protein